MSWDILKLKVPFTMIISGQTGSGKTRFVYELLRHNEQIFDKPFQKVIYAYSMFQPIYEDIRQMIPETEFSVGIPEEIQSEEKQTLLILDDLMIEVQNDKRVVNFFTKMRHTNLSTIFIVQNLYFKSQYATTITRNAQYMVIFPNLRDAALIATLGRQIFPRYRNFLPTAFEEATSSPHKYLFLDLKSDSDHRLRVRSNVFPGEEPVIYRPKCS